MKRYIRGSKYDKQYIPDDVYDDNSDKWFDDHVASFWDAYAFIDDNLREFGKEDFNFQPLRSYKYYRNAFSSTTTAIAISNAIKNKYSNLIGKDKITVVYNGFNINNLLGPIHEIKDNCFKILITGQVSESKGQDQAISACRLLANEGLNIELYIAGKVDWDYINKHFQNIEIRQITCRLEDLPAHNIRCSLKISMNWNR